MRMVHAFFAAAVHARPEGRRGARAAAEGIDEHGREGRERHDRQKDERCMETARTSPTWSLLSVLTPILFAEHMCFATAACVRAPREVCLLLKIYQPADLTRSRRL